MKTAPPTDSAVAFLSTYEAPGTPLERARTLTEAIDALTVREVARARALGASWTAIGDQLGIARQTATLRYARAVEEVTL